MPSSAGEDGTDGLGAVPSVLPILRTDGTVDNTGPILVFLRQDFSRINAIAWFPARTLFCFFPTCPPSAGGGGVLRGSFRGQFDVRNRFEHTVSGTRILVVGWTSAGRTWLAEASHFSLGSCSCFSHPLLPVAVILPAPVVIPLSLCCHHCF
jgi:hypothetical protein